MSHHEYTRQLTARQLINWIANDYVELSHDKILWQRNDFMAACKDWLRHNPEDGQLEFDFDA